MNALQTILRVSKLSERIPPTPQTTRGGGEEKKCAADKLRSLKNHRDDPCGLCICSFYTKEVVVSVNIDTLTASRHPHPHDQPRLRKNPSLNITALAARRLQRRLVFRTSRSEPQTFQEHEHPPPRSCFSHRCFLHKPTSNQPPIIIRSYSADDFMTRLFGDS